MAMTETTEQVMADVDRQIADIAARARASTERVEAARGEVAELEARKVQLMADLDAAQEIAQRNAKAVIESARDKAADLIDEARGEAAGIVAKAEAKAADYDRRVAAEKELDARIDAKSKALASLNEQIRTNRAALAGISR